MSYEAIDQFRTAMVSRGLIPPVEILADGQIHRCDTDQRNGKGDGAYMLHLNGVLPAGGFQNHQDGLGWENWRADIGRHLTAKEQAKQRQVIETAKCQREEESARRYAAGKAKAQQVFANASPAKNHWYLLTKGVGAHGTRVSIFDDVEYLLVPMFKDGEIVNLQRIPPDGREKRPLTGAEKVGSYFPIGETANPERIFIGEGFSTTASVYECTGVFSVCAFDTGNLALVAQRLRAKYPRAEIVFAADDDWKKGNAGEKSANKAASLVGGRVILPQFGEDRSDHQTDFNDLMLAIGHDAVRAQIETMLSLPSPQTESTGWPEPQSLTARVDPEPYPLDALPPIIQAAVVEVQAFTKAPMPLVAGCALSTLSVACQGHIDVERSKGLRGPTSLYMLTIADSGERKSTVDAFFSEPIKVFQDTERERMKPELDKYASELMAWKAEIEGVTAAIREASKRNDGKSEGNVDALKLKLAEIQADQPIAPAVPRLVLGDETPENLAWTLAKIWPSAGVVSSEAGLVLGSQSMGKDSVMRNLGLLNIVWDGGLLNIGRKTSETFTVDAVRLTMGLQVQSETLRGFIENTGELARGTGWFARFMVSQPQSTQGTRFYTDPPENYPSLTAFRGRISEILNTPLEFDSQRKLMPKVMRFTPEAKALWIKFHDMVETEVGSGGELYDVKDVASKAADNVARLAALFQMLEHGVGFISPAMVMRASRLVAWHLNEARRFFGEIALPKELADAVRLERWLIKEARSKDTCTVSKRHAQQYGEVRDGKRLNEAIKELESLDRIRQIQHGKKVLLQLNPLLLESCREAG